VSGSDVIVCDRFQAAFVSPRVANSLQFDPTLDEFSLNCADSRSFKLICELIVGESINIDENNIEIWKLLIEDLGNCELSELILNFVEQTESLSLSNCISRLKQKVRLNVEIDREIEFIASHFSEFDIDSIRLIDISRLKDILKSNSLQILNEDWLFQVLIDIDSLYFELIGFVRFEYLSSSSIDFFFEHVSFDNLTADIWHQLWIRSRHRIVYDTKIFPLNRFRNCAIRSPESPFSGLLCHLCEMCGGNVHEKDVVQITCSSTRHNQCWQIVNYDWNNWFETKNSSNSWIQIDFKDRIVSLTDYALKSDGDSGYHLVEWQLSGSIDGNKWTIVDDEKTQDLNGKSITKIFHCNVNSSDCQFYRYIRLTQTGKNSSGYDHLELSNIEFFGWMMTSTINKVLSDA
jgi:hypothetical protein